MVSDPETVSLIGLENDDHTDFSMDELTALALERQNWKLEEVWRKRNLGKEIYSIYMFLQRWSDEVQWFVVRKNDTELNLYRIPLQQQSSAELSQVKLQFHYDQESVLKMHAKYHSRIGELMRQKGNVTDTLELRLVELEATNKEDIEKMERRHHSKVSSLERELMDSERKRLSQSKETNQNQIPLIVSSVGVGMLSSVVCVILIWFLCKNKRNYPKVNEASEDAANDLVDGPCFNLDDEHESDDEVIRDHIMVTENGHHVTAGWLGDEPNLHEPDMDGNEEHDDEEKAEFEEDSETKGR